MYSVKEIGYGEWETYIGQCRNVNMLQCWQYGAAKEQSEKWRAVRFLVTDEQGEGIALSQILVRDLPLIGGVARLNRGPLLIGAPEPDKAEQKATAVLAALLKACRKRRWWLVQMAPELNDTEAARQSLRNMGLRQLPIAPSASGLIALEADDEEVMASLHGKWRNCLRKGLRLGVSVTLSEGNSSELNLLLERYRKLQTDKGFHGVPEALVLALANQKGTAWQFNLFIAYEDGSSNLDDAIGTLVSIRHGDTSTYFIGSTTDKGRNLQANYVLLWQAIQHANSTGCMWFDIGGLNATTPQGIAHFKQGVNATPYALVGEWRRFLSPFSKISTG